MPVTYYDYLKLEQLLQLQRPLSEPVEHDEMLFIIIHQVYELWFMQLLHEIDYLRARLLSGDWPHSMHTLRRILTIFKTLVKQVDVLETMTPLEFLSFRSRLDQASGFQSYQFREIEFSLGQKDINVVKRFPENSRMRKKLEGRFEQISIWTAFLHYLNQIGYPISADQLEPATTATTSPNPNTQQQLVRVYHEDPITTQICERLVDLDEAVQEWRYRHVKMVERTIGTKHGTGGSSGVEYLKKTLFRPIFPDLWIIRAPPLTRPTHHSTTVSTTYDWTHGSARKGSGIDNAFTSSGCHAGQNVAILFFGPFESLVRFHIHITTQQANLAITATSPTDTHSQYPHRLTQQPRESKSGHRLEWSC